MESIVCRECGLVNWPKEGALSCIRCGGPIWKRNDYGSGFAFAGKQENTAVFSGFIKFLTIFFGVEVVVLLLSRILLGGTEVALAVGVLFGLVGLVFSLVVSIWFLKEVFSESVGWGLASIFLPFASLIALIMFWDKTQRPFFANLLTIGIVFTAFLTMGPVK